MASGVLPVLIGRATRLADFIHVFPKSYVAIVRLGVATTTDDAEGDVLAEAPIRPFDLDEVLPRFRGEITQTPPQYSAVQVNGQRAYAVARRGGALTLAARTVTIHALTVSPLSDDTLELSLTCSSGTYVRALARDLAEALGTVGHLTKLTRTQVGPFTIATSHSLEQLAESGVGSALLPPDAALPDAPTFHATDTEAAKLRQGQFLPYAGPPAELVKVFATDDQHLLCLAHSDGATLKPRIML